MDNDNSCCLEKNFSYSRLLTKLRLILLEVKKTW